MGSYPFEEMTQGELEHAATSPHRFRDVMASKRASGEKVLPAGTQFLTGLNLLYMECFGIENDVELVRFGYMNLVPGGRFLATRSMENVLQLWDLGVGGRVEVLAGSRPLASTPLGEGHIHFEPDVHVTGDGEGLLIAMSQAVGGR